MRFSREIFATRGFGNENDPGAGMEPEEKRGILWSFREKDSEIALVESRGYACRTFSTERSIFNTIRNNKHLEKGAFVNCVYDVSTRKITSIELVVLTGKVQTMTPQNASLTLSIAPQVKLTSNQRVAECKFIKAPSETVASACFNPSNVDFEVVKNQEVSLSLMLNVKKNTHNPPYLDLIAVNISQNVTPQKSKTSNALPTRKQETRVNNWMARRMATNSLRSGESAKRTTTSNNKQKLAKPVKNTSQLPKTSKASANSDAKVNAICDKKRTIEEKAGKDRIVYNPDRSVTSALWTSRSNTPEISEKVQKRDPGKNLRTPERTMKLDLCAQDVIYDLSGSCSLSRSPARDGLCDPIEHRGKSRSPIGDCIWDPVGLNLNRSTGYEPERNVGSFDPNTNAFPSYESSSSYLGSSFGNSSSFGRGYEPSSLMGSYERNAYIDNQRSGRVERAPNPRDHRRNPRSSPHSLLSRQYGDYYPSFRSSHSPDHYTHESPHSPNYFDRYTPHESSHSTRSTLASNNWASNSDNESPQLREKKFNKSLEHHRNRNIPVHVIPFQEYARGPYENSFSGRGSTNRNSHENCSSYTRGANSGQRKRYPNQNTDFARGGRSSSQKENSW